MKSLFSAVSGYPMATSCLVARPKMGVHRKDKFEVKQFESKVGPIEFPCDKDFVLNNLKGLKRFLVGERHDRFLEQPEWFNLRYEADSNFRNWLGGICKTQINQLKKKDVKDVLWARFFAYQDKTPTAEGIGQLKSLTSNRIRELLKVGFRCFRIRKTTSTFQSLYKLWEGRIQKELQFSNYGKIAPSIAETLPADRVVKAQQVLDALDLYLQENNMKVDEIAIVPGASVTLAKTLERLKLTDAWNRLTPGEQFLLGHHEIQQQEKPELLTWVNERAKDWLAFVTQPTVRAEDLHLVLQSARAKLTNP